LEFLIANARQEASAQDAEALAQFQLRAKAWREAAVKPPMPEEGHEHQVLAEFAFKEKDVDKAINEYSAALAVFPTWPEGQYNLATLAGEKKFYALAILHMKEYLEMVSDSPNSPDAQAAKDSVIIWKDKLNTALANSTINAGAGSTQTRGNLFQQVNERTK
jgi:tetratricopeptide (TPR) repeat protein